MKIETNKEHKKIRKMTERKKEHAVRKAKILIAREFEKAQNIRIFRPFTKAVTVKSTLEDVIRFFKLNLLVDQFKP